ncbi:hypothetical protein [Photorhabdus sp. CRCIA-P01]|uniref:hypothetical protein n=1 Tax=Photorhabdus sp. CRCIA-P01 TaxID=2019570 RepID=UPI000E5A011B|nr:hypothetical protein [Photorhabdus sp. CRCIA-P01]
MGTSGFSLDIPLNEQLGSRASLTITRNGVTERTIHGLIAGAGPARYRFLIFTWRLNEQLPWPGHPFS